MFWDAAVAGHGVTLRLDLPPLPQPEQIWYLNYWKTLPVPMRMGNLSINIDTTDFLMAQCGISGSANETSLWLFMIL